jgi:hypothetical protein
MILYGTQTPQCIYVDKTLLTILKQFVKYFDYKHIQNLRLTGNFETSERGVMFL